MAVKYVCDICQETITSQNRANDNPDNTNLTRKLELDGRSLVLRATIGNEVADKPLDVCKHCVLDALYELDDRVARPGPVPPGDE